MIIFSLTDYQRYDNLILFLSDTTRRKAMYEDLEGNRYNYDERDENYWADRDDED